MLTLEPQVNFEKSSEEFCYNVRVDWHARATNFPNPLIDMLDFNLSKEEADRIIAGDGRFFVGHVYMKYHNNRKSSFPDYSNSVLDRDYFQEYVRYFLPSIIYEDDLVDFLVSEIDYLKKDKKQICLFADINYFKFYGKLNFVNFILPSIRALRFYLPFVENDLFFHTDFKQKMNSHDIMSILKKMNDWKLEEDPALFSVCCLKKRSLSGRISLSSDWVSNFSLDVPYKFKTTI